MTFDLGSIFYSNLIVSLEVGTDYQSLLSGSGRIKQSRLVPPSHLIITFCHPSENTRQILVFDVVLELANLASNESQFLSQ
jgi:hypothetical protein